FQATLEEVKEADLLVHVRDIAHPDTEAQKRDVEDVLARLRPSEDEIAPPMLEVLNKADLLPPEQREVFTNRVARANEQPILVSAQTGEGIGDLLGRFDDLLGRRRR